MSSWTLGSKVPNPIFLSWYFLLSYFFYWADGNFQYYFGWFENWPYETRQHPTFHILFFIFLRNTSNLQFRPRILAICAVWQPSLEFWIESLLAEYCVRSTNCPLSFKVTREKIFDGLYQWFLKFYLGGLYQWDGYCLKATKKLIHFIH